MSMTTDTPTTDRTVEYGARLGDSIRWVDRDGDLPIGNGDYVWGAKGKSEAELRAALARLNPTPQLVKRYRSVVVTEPEIVAPPLPTAKGSVVRATVQARGGEAVERLFFSYGDRDVWVADRPVNSYRHTAEASELTVVDVILDASTL